MALFCLLFIYCILSWLPPHRRSVWGIWTRLRTRKGHFLQPSVLPRLTRWHCQPLGFSPRSLLAPHQHASWGRCPRLRCLSLLTGFCRVSPHSRPVRLQGPFQTSIWWSTPRLKLLNGFLLPLTVKAMGLERPRCSGLGPAPPWVLLQPESLVLFHDVFMWGLWCRCGKSTSRACSSPLPPASVVPKVRFGDPWVSTHCQALRGAVSVIPTLLGSVTWCPLTATRPQRSAHRQTSRPPVSQCVPPGQRRSRHKGPPALKALTKNFAKVKVRSTFLGSIVFIKMYVKCNRFIFKQINI